MKLLPFLLVPVLASCASTEEKVAHNEAQIRIIAVQREAQKEEREAAAEAQKELYRALAAVAAADPSQSGVVAMALAFQGMQGGSNEESNTPIVQLQARQDRALQWAQALSPVAGSLVATLGVSAINASVQKDQIAATRDIQTNSQNQHAAVVTAVAGLGQQALANAGDNYAGDVYTLSDEAYIDQSSITSMDTFTETVTSTSSDSNTTYDATDDGFIVNGNYDYQLVDESSTVSYGGEPTTVGSVVEYLQGLGQPYTLTLDGQVISSSSEGKGEAVTVNCDLTFGPIPPTCTGG